MNRQRGMTWVEVLVIVFLIIALMGILLPWLGRARRNSRMMSNSTPVRGLQQGLILYAQGNNGWYAGLTRDGQLADPITPVPYKTYGAAQKLGSLSMAILLNGNYFTPGYLINPGETNPAIKEITTQGMVTIANYSYAVSRAENAATDAGRIAEWRDNANPLAVVISDRVLDAGKETTGEVAPDRQNSIWTTTPGDWRGAVVFGDNSTEFATTSPLTKTKYGKTTNSDDNLFQIAGPADAFQIRD